MLNGTGAVAASVFYMDIHDLQATVTAGSCSSRVVFNVPKARSQGLEIEFEDAPNRNVSFAISGSFNNSELRTTLTSTDPSGAVSVVSGIKKGGVCRRSRKSRLRPRSPTSRRSGKADWRTSRARISTSALA